MDADRWRRVQEVLDTALTREPTEWPAVLDETCSGDPELRREVEALLARLDTAQGFLESPPVGLAAALVAEAREVEAGPSHIGRRIGAYRLVQEIGRGGMARVFLAERADGQFEQQVALKLLRPGMDTEIDRERFRAERQILATLNHPNIARLLDGGVTDDGQPYLVMELVEGQPIDAFCDEGGLSVGERLELFLTVCEATQYAHGRLVVHRDLKPSNILVGADAGVKLLDFGLARLLEPQAPLPLMTVTGQRWMTPEYAAPEQIRGKPVTTLTDVYQLGVVLYRLLAGRAPFAGRGGSLHELEEAVLHEDPEPPSAAARQSRGVATDKPLKGDLDAVVIKALRKEPEARYVSVHALADDLRRHLSGQPVLARQQTTGYRARRFVRRHRLGLATAAVVLLLGSTYAVTVTIQREQVRQALTEARLGTQRAEQVTDFMLGLFEAAEAGQALTDSVTARELLTRGVQQAREMSERPAMRAQQLDVIGRLYTQLGDYERAQPLLEEALAIRRRLHGEVHADVATSLENLALVTVKRDVTRAVELGRQALALRRRLSGDEDPKALAALYQLSNALHQAGEDSRAGALFEEWMSIIAHQPREITPARADQLTDAAALLEIRGEVDRAEAMFREALAIRRELYGERHHLVARSLGSLGSLFHRDGRPEEAEPLLREAVELLRATYPDGHPLLALELKAWGNTLARLGRFQDAAASLREALALNRRFIGENTINVALTEMDLSFALSRSGEYDESESLAQHAVRILRQELGDDNAMVVVGGLVLGNALRGQGRYAEAEPLLLDAYERFATPKPVTAPWRDSALASLVRLYEAQERDGEAAKYQALLDAPALPPAASTTTAAHH